MVVNTPIMIAIPGRKDGPHIVAPVQLNPDDDESGDGVEAILRWLPIGSRSSSFGIVDL